MTTAWDRAEARGELRSSAAIVVCCGAQLPKNSTLRGTLSDPVEGCHPIKRKPQHDPAGARRPAERPFRLPHALSRTDDPPQYVLQARSGSFDRALEPPFGIDLRAGKVRP